MMGGRATPYRPFRARGESINPLILNLLKDGRQDFQIPRIFLIGAAAILQQVQDERKGAACGRCGGIRQYRSGFPLTRE